MFGALLVFSLNEGFSGDAGGSAGGSRGRWLHTGRSEAMAESIGLKTGDARFWDAADLRAQIDRVFDICHSCRLCFKFCGSFPALFEMLDAIAEKRRAAYLAEHPEVVEAAMRKRAAAAAAPSPAHEGERAEGFGDEMPEIVGRARDLSEEQVDRVVGLCFQCKLCYPNCPYTPPHEFAVDFPRLLLRWKAHRVRRESVPWRTRIVRNTALLGGAASLAPGLAAWALRSRLPRWLMERMLGIHREKLLPPFAGETFSRWWTRRLRPPLPEPLPLREGVQEPVPLRVALFATCLVEYNEPVVGKAAVQVLEHNGVEVVYPEGQGCCGMPLLDGGDVDAVLRYAEKNLAVLEPWVQRGYEVVIPSPSCSLVVREEYPQLSPGAAAASVAARARDLCDYLFRLGRDGRLRRDFGRRLQRVKYHVPCHLRAQNIGFRGRDLLRLVADEVEVIQECSGHDGTWSMQKEHFEESLHWGRKLFAALQAGEGPCAACTDCALAATQIRQATGLRAVHPVVALAFAYGFDVEGAREALEAVAEAQ